MVIHKKTKDAIKQIRKNTNKKRRINKWDKR